MTLVNAAGGVNKIKEESGETFSVNTSTQILSYTPVAGRGMVVRVIDII